MTEAEKTIQGLVPVKMESGEYFIKFNNRANQMIYEKTGKRAIEYLKDLHNEAIGNVKKNVETEKTEMGMIEALEKIMQPKDVSFLLYCGLIHTGKYNSVEDVEADMILSQEFVYIGAIIIAVGKLLTDYLTAGQNTK